MELANNCYKLVEDGNGRVRLSQGIVNLLYDPLAITLHGLACAYIERNKLR